jgi:hypothetical protein
VKKVDPDHVRRSLGSAAVTKAILGFVSMGAAVHPVDHDHRRVMAQQPAVIQALSPMRER